MYVEGDFNVDTEEQILPWCINLMHECFGDDIPLMQLSVPHIRHNLYSWNCKGTEHSPLTPEQFADILIAHHDHELIEFVMHPALPEPGDDSLNMLFTAEMRIKDTEAAIRIFESGVMDKCGFEIFLCKY